MPPDYAAEMVPFDPLVGEFRVHYAGFFDPGFGYAGAGGRGARAVLEVRSREVPFILEHGQIVGRLVYEKMLARPAHALRRGHRLELPGAGPEAVEAFPQLTRCSLLRPLPNGERAALFCNMKEWVRGFASNSTAGNPLTPTLSPNGERERTEFAARMCH